MQLHTDSFRPPEQQQQQDNPLVLPWLFFMLIIHGWASMIYPLIRQSFGASFFRIREFFGFFVLWMYVGQTQHPDNYGIFILYTVLVFGMMIHHGARANQPENRLNETPRYNGYPLIIKFLPISEKNAKIFFEPLCIFLVGLLIAALGEVGFGRFLMIGAVACLIDFARIYDRDLRIARQMHEAEMKMRYNQQVYEQFKKGRY